MTDTLGCEHSLLCKRIRTWDREYYLLCTPSVPDSEYDRVMKQVRDIEATRPDLITPNSPTQRVGH